MMTSLSAELLDTISLIKQRFPDDYEELLNGTTTGKSVSALVAEGKIHAAAVKLTVTTKALLFVKGLTDLQDPRASRDMDGLLSSDPKIIRPNFSEADLDTFFKDNQALMKLLSK